MRLEGRSGRRHDPIDLRRNALEAVASRWREQQLERAAGSNQAGYAGRHRRLEADAASKQGSPREPYGHEVGRTGEGRGRHLGCGENEPGIRAATLASRSGSAPGGLDHCRRAGIETEDEGCRLAGGQIEHGSTVTRSDIDRHPLVAGNEVGNLADVHLVELPADDESGHAGEDIRRRKVTQREAASGCSGGRRLAELGNRELDRELLAPDDHAAYRADVDARRDVDVEVTIRRLERPKLHRAIDVACAIR